jgi:hypothetical protein
MSVADLLFADDDDDLLTTTTTTTNDLYPVFYDVSSFPALLPLRDNWQAIAAELARLPLTTLDIDRSQRTWGSGATKFVETMATQQGWVFAWQATRPGEPETRNESWLNYPLVYEDHPIGLNAQSAPVTLALLSKMRGIHAAGFSLLRPNAEIFPHTDTTGAEWGNLAFHLGLDVPADGECALVVQPDSRISQEEDDDSAPPADANAAAAADASLVVPLPALRAVESNGHCIVFDATHTHHAFNHSATSNRSILYIDFEMKDAAALSTEQSTN